MDGAFSSSTVDLCVTVDTPGMPWIQLLRQTTNRHLLRKFTPPVQSAQRGTDKHLGFGWEREGDGLIDAGELG